MKIESLCLETPRLLLRPPRREDFDSWATMMTDPEVTRFLGGPQPRTLAWRGFMTMAGSWSLLGFGMFSVIHKPTGRWIGRLGPWVPEGWPGTEIGWGLTRESWGQGLATEGAAAAMTWACETLGWTDIVHPIAPENHASQAVAKKLGSRNRGPGSLPAPLAGVRIDIWGQSSSEWRRRNPACRG
jgi:RimJ/RimL family protein N-acetyltransferase